MAFNITNNYIQIQEVLAVIREASKALESNTATLDNSIPALDFLLEQFESGRTEHSDKPLGASFNSAWAKLDKYYGRTDESSAYNAAVALHPSNKLEYFRLVWEGHPTWIIDAEHKITELWKSKWSGPFDNHILIYPACYKPKHTVLAIPTQSPGSYSRDPNRFTQWKASKQHITPMVTDNTDELERYFMGNLVANIKNPIEWWLESTQQRAYPNLARMAVDLLSIPAMAADPERLFSSAGYMINNRRNGLKIDTIQALECLKSWYMLGQIGQCDRDLSVAGSSDSQLQEAWESSPTN